MPSEPLAPSQVLALLRETPARLTALTADLAPEVVQTRPTPDAWSANEVLAHMRACADVWGGCIMTMIAEDKPTLRAVNPRSCRMLIFRRQGAHEKVFDCQHFTTCIHRGETRCSLRRRRYATDEGPTIANARGL